MIVIGKSFSAKYPQGLVQYLSRRSIILSAVGPNSIMEYDVWDQDKLYLRLKILRKPKEIFKKLFQN